MQFVQFTVSFFFFFWYSKKEEILFLLVSHDRLWNKVNGSWGQFLLCQHFLSKTLGPKCTQLSQSTAYQAFIQRSLIKNLQMLGSVLHTAGRMLKIHSSYKLVTRA